MKAVRARRVKGYSGVSPRGASRRQGRQELSPEAKGRIRKLLGLVVLVGLLAGAYHFGSTAVGPWLQRPVASVAVEGEFRYLPKERVMTVISTQITTDFLQLDLAILKRVLEQEPWIERAALARRWPDTLQVRIYEQQPIARWGDTGFLNFRGEVIELDSNAMLQDLPWLHGSDSEAIEIMQRYQDLAKLLRSRGMDIAKLASDGKRAWRMTLGNGVEIAIGRDQVMEKVQRFVRVYDLHLQESWAEVQAIDVRYSNGVAVRWRPEGAAGADN
jgi:cell division protein FtsQ